MHFQVHFLFRFSPITEARKGCRRQPKPIRLFRRDLPWFPNQFGIIRFLPQKTNKVAELYL